MKKQVLLVVALLGSALLASCGGGGDDDAPQIATSDFALAANATTGPEVAAAISGETFTFPNGVPEFGTTSTTTATVTATSGTPTFSIEADGNTASGDLEFGSCHFRIRSSTFGALHPLGVGHLIIISRCEFSLSTHGFVADGAARDIPGYFRLNSILSLQRLILTRLLLDGSIFVRGQDLGNVPVTDLTGGSAR